MAHQQEHGRWLSNGFKKLGFIPTVTDQLTDDADIHVVSGPHYAKAHNQDKRTILLDRAFWGDPESVTLAWALPGGGKLWFKNAPGGRDQPELKPWKTGNRAIVLPDYGNPMTDQIDEACYWYQIELRMHPTERPSKWTLQETLDRNSIAIGMKSTALVDAAINGLSIICLDKSSPVAAIASNEIGKTIQPDRKQWLNNLSYHNWKGEEINNGTALEQILCQLSY